MSAIGERLKAHVESYNPPRLTVKVGNCNLLMHWAWQEGRKELLAEILALSKDMSADEILEYIQGLNNEK